MSEQAKVEVKPRTMRPISGSFKHFTLQHHAHRVHVARPPYETTKEDILAPAFWVNVVGQIREDDFIEVLPEGLEWYAKLVVLKADATSAKVKLLQFVQLADQIAAPLVSADYTVDRAGRWFRVIRKSDASVMKSGLESEQSAKEWAAAELKLTL